MEFQWLRDQQANMARNRPAASLRRRRVVAGGPKQRLDAPPCVHRSGLHRCGKKGCDIVKTLRRWVRILCFKVGMIPALIACTAAGTVLRFIS